MGGGQWNRRRMKQPTIEGSIKDRWWSRNRGVAESQADRRQRNNRLRWMRTRCGGGGGGGGTCNYDDNEAFGGDKHPSSREERVAMMMTMLLMPPTEVRRQLTRGDGAIWGSNVTISWGGQ